MRKRDLEDAVYERTGAIREEREEKEKATKRADEAMARIKVLEATRICR